MSGRSFGLDSTLVLGGGGRSVARTLPHTERFAWCGNKSLGNSMSLRGISGVVLGYSRFDGGATSEPGSG